MPMKIESSLSPELDVLIHNVIGAAIEVHRNLGPGFLESIYEQAICYEFDQRDIPYTRQKEIVIPYKSIKLTGQRFDLLVADQLILELKATESLHPIFEAQIISYLRALRLRAGLLINFNVKLLTMGGIKRIVL